VAEAWRVNYGKSLKNTASEHLAVDDRGGVEFAVEAGQRVAGGGDRHADRGFLAEPSAVGGEDHVVEGEQRVVLGWRFLVENVEGGGDDEAWGLAGALQAGYQHRGRGGILWRGGS
jgi:hypothetical protein